MPTREVMIEMGFSSAHALRGYQGKCENTHGHNYKVEVYVRGKELNHIGLLIDFKDLKAATKKVVDYLDHKNINVVFWRWAPRPSPNRISRRCFTMSGTNKWT